MKERVTVSLDAQLAGLVRQQTAGTPGGMSGYLERLIRQDQLKEAVAAVGRWHASHPEVAEADEAERLAVADEAERLAVADELGENA